MRTEVTRMRMDWAYWACWMGTCMGPRKVVEKPTKASSSLSSQRAHSEGTSSPPIRLGPNPSLFGDAGSTAPHQPSRSTPRSLSRAAFLRTSPVGITRSSEADSSHRLSVHSDTSTMGKLQKGRVADLSRTLQRVTASLNGTFVLLNEAAPAESVKGDWSEVKKAADLVSKNSTTIGLLWTQGPKVDEAAEAMKTFADSLQGLILLCHGYTVGGGPTLSQTIRNAVKVVLDAGLSLLARAVSFSVKGSAREEREAALPALVGCVWEGCNAIKKTPYTNRAAIGRSLAQVATSVKDVLREIGEMREGKPADQADDCGCGHSHEETAATGSHGHSHSHDHGHGPCGHDHGHDHDHDHSGHLHTHDHSGHGQCGHDHSHGGHSHSGYGHSHAPVHAHNHSHSHGNCGHDHGPSGHSHPHEHAGHEDCGHDHGDGSSSIESLEFNDELSPEEMEVADATKGVVTSVLDFVKQLLYVAADPQQGNDASSTLYLENVLKHCKSLGVEVDEFGVSLYPPQEINQLRDRITKSDALVESIKEEVKAAKGSVPEGLEMASETVRNAQTHLKQCLGGLS